MGKKSKRRNKANNASKQVKKGNATQEPSGVISTQTRAPGTKLPSPNDSTTKAESKVNSTGITSTIEETTNKTPQVLTKLSNGVTQSALSKVDSTKKAFMKVEASRDISPAKIDSAKGGLEQSAEKMFQSSGMKQKVSQRAFSTATNKFESSKEQDTETSLKYNTNSSAKISETSLDREEVDNSSKSVENVFVVAESVSHRTGSVENDSLRKCETESVPTNLAIEEKEIETDSSVMADRMETKDGVKKEQMILIKHSVRGDELNSPTNVEDFGNGELVVSATKSINCSDEQVSSLTAPAGKESSEKANDECSCAIL
mmetsp:Transcript_14778/g.16938  ORF Transcript_14778/g.16938 Transcript_14778/m.16938 type:complete len:316 (+) Transcript_14778:118-1065(+)|eukprot:CAMPEP_0194145324 /NCGR_PEP_ID=MMETSP0152-20130528/16725_1 /TAXON_ID=1049557 /ORGANISM="Thalassiothrix antarctica, Strain L6-D1" /LENGTH=315 /DNA_ID=CAMNT_0038845501 /DNA_START=83 /DNA_END=1030 /DNA_ORIENTATION=+